MGDTVERPNSDPNSFSRPDECVVKDVYLEWEIDFGQNIVFGHAILEVDCKKENVEELVLDTRDLQIRNVTDIGTNQKVKFTLSEPVSAFGSKLTVVLPEGSEDKSYTFKIEYATSPKSSALQWLRPEQTAGKQQPYLFSQCEAIHARSLLPCQDTPSVKTPYSAKVTTSSKLTVLMSALRDADPSEHGEKKTYTFKQKVPIPSYLIAVVVGALECRKISERIDVWSEKEIVDKAAFEFSEAETMLKTAEDIVGPYIWNRYDILVLPPSFAFGGMENPCLTFVTPTLLAGDRSQANVIAHEISHSWTGNLVTNRSFEHFWLNEGFTVFLERKIVGRMFGEAHRQFVSIGGWKDLADIVKTLGEQHPFTKLVVDLKGVDPDDAFSSVPYEKGYAFLYYLEQLLGGQQIFETFLRSYINEYKYKSIDTDTWKMFLIKYFKNEKNAELSKIDWNAWLYQPGMPPETLHYDTALEDACHHLCLKWIEANSSELDQFSAQDLSKMSSLQIQEFLTLLLENETLPLNKIELIAKLYNFNSTKNSEIRFRWLRLCLQSHWKEIIPLAIEFAVEQGRMKYVRPIYRALYAWEESRPVAIQTFLDHKHEMMYMTAHCIAKELHLENEMS